MKINEKEIGDGQPCYITLEAGPTHNGLMSAMALVDVAKTSGADAIKFQIFDPDHLVSDRNLLFSYEVLLDQVSGKTETIVEPLYDILCRRCLSTNEWKKIKRYCDEVGIEFFSTVSDDSTFSLIESLELPSIKIASADVNHFPLIRKIARMGKTVQLDTGNATLGEIEAAVDIIREEGNENIIIHNCPSGYPARLPSINLRMIPTIHQLFKTPVAFSDHSPGWEMDIAALALGANLIEKTITLDKTTRSVEHIMSLEPNEVSSFVQSIRDVEVALGHPRRILTDMEKDKRQSIRRSVFLPDGVVKGTRLKDAKVEFRRPGFGISPEQYEQYCDMAFRNDMNAGANVQMEHLVNV